MQMQLSSDNPGLGEPQDPIWEIFVRRDEDLKHRESCDNRTERRVIHPVAKDCREPPEDYKSMKGTSPGAFEHSRTVKLSTSGSELTVTPRAFLTMLFHIRRA